MARYALVRTSDSIVTNITEWDGVSPYTPPTGTTAVLDAAAKAIIGATFIAGVAGTPPARLSVEAADFFATYPREFIKMIMSAFVAQGALTQAKADAILLAVMTALTR